MHYWGDKWFKENGEDLHSAIGYCSKVFRKYGRINCWGKEKYGCYRDELHSLWDGSLHKLIWPGYIRIVSMFIYNVDRYFFIPVNKFLGITKLFRLYQSIVYNYAIQKMCKKYPNIIDEIVSDLDGYEMVKPGIFGNVSGVEIHKKYWKEL